MSTGRPVTTTSPKISLLHATHHREGGPLAVKEAWLGRAERPDQIEYVFAMDADDESSVAETAGHTRVVSPSANGQVTSVRNWNAAAAASSGDLLMVVADDLFPPPGWDTALLNIIGPLDPLKTSFAAKVTDSPEDDSVLLRHPVLSRNFYQRLGLFGPQYRGVFCDTDLTTRAFWRSVILDGRSLVLEHRHPTLDHSVSTSKSHALVNAVDENDFGREVFRSAWSPRQRGAQRLVVRTPRTRVTSRAVLWSLRCRNWTTASAGYLWRRVVGHTKAMGRLARSPRKLVKRLFRR